MTNEFFFTTRQVTLLCPVTFRQLQWWDERKLVSPRQLDHKRLYSTQDLFFVLLIRELRAREFSMPAIRKIVAEIRRPGVGMPPESRKWLLTNGERVVFLAHGDEVLAFLEQRRSPAFVLLPLLPLHEKVERAILKFCAPISDIPFRKQSPVERISFQQWAEKRA